MRFSYILALVILIAVGAYVYSGDLVIGGRGDTEPAIAESNENENEEALVRVKIVRSVAQTREAVLHLRGRTQAEDRVKVRAETEGVIQELAVRKGQSVDAGDLLCRLDTRTRSARLAEAEALLAQVSADYDAVEQLSEKGFAAKTRVRTLKAQRDAAAAAVEAAQWDLRQTEVRAPISGIIEDLDVRTGSLLRAGDICAGIVDIDPMLAIANVSERELAGLSVGALARVSPVTGDTVEGTVSYIAPAADEATRTFRVEVKLDNADGLLRDGITSGIDIPLNSEPAHRFSPAALVLRDDGVIGVRAVDSDDKVVFHPVEILADGKDGIWAGGLPDSIDLIVTGQEYVVDGATVEGVRETAEATQ